MLQTQRRGLRLNHRNVAAAHGQSRPRLSLQFLSAATLCLVLSGQGEAAQPLTCAGSSVVVEAADPADREAGCRGAESAAAFLAASGVDTQVPVRISFVESLPPSVGALPAVGCYVRSEDRVYVLSFARCQHKKLEHDVVIDRPVHVGLVTHEVAHAIVRADPRGAKLGLVAHEYIAYVAMYATMPPDRRGEVLAQIPGDGFESELHINSFIYAVDPVRFGAQSYRHYLKPGIGRSFLASVLNGQVVLDVEAR
jgi:hypothetical protein